MPQECRHHSLTDKLIVKIDQGLRRLSSPSNITGRANPANDIMDLPLTQVEKYHSAGLMRVNHVGEVCAQALYQGQALCARTTRVCASMQQSAREEVDHLNWCRQRLHELDSHTSYLSPAFYLGALLIGAVAALAGDKWSLGFVAETERQVVKHLNSHLDILPPNDLKSRAIIEQMCNDEAQHANNALAAGAQELPTMIKTLMALSAKIMTSSTYLL